MSRYINEYEMSGPSTAVQSSAPRSAFGAHRGYRDTLSSSHGSFQQTSGSNQQYQQGNSMVYLQPTSQPTSQPPSYWEAMAARDATPASVPYPQRFNGHEQSSYDARSGKPTSGRPPRSDAHSGQRKQTAGIPSSSTLNRPTAAHLNHSNYSSTAETHTPTQHSGSGGYPDRGHEGVYVGRASQTAGGAAVTSEAQTPKKIKSRTDTAGWEEFCCEIGCHGLLGICQVAGEILCSCC